MMIALVTLSGDRFGNRAGFLDGERKKTHAVGQNARTEFDYANYELAILRLLPILELDC